MAFKTKPAIEGKALWEPQEGPQSVFYWSNLDEIMYGGQAGGGKSDGIMGVSLKQVGNPFYRALILRRTLKELKMAEGLIDKSRRLLYGVASWNGEDNSFTFPTGARVDFGYCDSDGDVYRYQGSGYTLIAFDELTRFTEFQYKTISGYVRSTHPGLTKMVRSATNPGNVGHAWVKRRFIDAMAPYEIVRSKQTGLLRQFIPAKVQDNKILMERDPDYIKRLMGLPEPWRTALLEGDWNIFAGQAFPEWGYDKHTCEIGEIPGFDQEKQELPRWYPRIISVDWGYTSQACAISMCQTSEPRKYAYREMYTKGIRPKEFAERLIETHRHQDGTHENIRTVVLDRACWAQTGSDKTIAQQFEEVFRKVGWGLTPSDSADRIGRKMLIHENLRLNQLRDISPRPPVDDYWSERFRLEGSSAIVEYESLGVGEVLPQLKILRPSQDGRWGCPNLLRTLPTLVLDEKKVEDVDTTQEDHAYDALGYALKELDARPGDKPMEEILRERMRGSDPSTRHIGVKVAEQEYRKQLTDGQPDTILYR